MAKARGEKLIADNRHARHEYHLLERVEAGLVLSGTEVKSLREGRVTLARAFADMRDGETWLVGATSLRTTRVGYAYHEPDRDRKLLLHRREIDRLRGSVQEKGLTLVPTKSLLQGRPGEGRDRARARARSSATSAATWRNGTPTAKSSAQFKAAPGDIDEEPFTKAAARRGHRPSRERCPRRLVRLAAIDFGPLRRHRDYRLLWIGLAVSLLRRRDRLRCDPVPDYKLTGSDAVVGLTGAGRARAAPRPRRSSEERSPMPLTGGGWSVLTELGLAALSAVLVVNLDAAAVRSSGCSSRGGSLAAVARRLPAPVAGRAHAAAGGAGRADGGRSARLSSLEARDIGGLAIGGVLIVTVGLRRRVRDRYRTFLFSLVMLSRCGRCRRL